MYKDYKKIGIIRSKKIDKNAEEKVQTFSK